MNGCYNTMGIDRVRGSAGVAACVLAVAAAFAPGLAAQGAKEANGRGRPSATVAGPSSHLQPARGILGDLVGTWQFQIWFAGNFSGTPDVSGIRVMKALFDDLRLEWTEVLDHSQVQGQGLVGFDPSSDRFFSTSVYNVGSAPELLTGIPDDAQPSITFYAISIAPGAGEPPPPPMSTLAMVDHDHFRRAARLDALERAAPEWRPWVELLRATFQADADLAPAPEPLTPDARPRSPADIAPLLHGRTVRFDAGRLRRLLQRLAELVDLRSVAELEVVGLAAAAVRQDGAVLEPAARQAEIEPAAFETVVNLAVWPLLQACGRPLQTHIP